MSKKLLLITVLTMALVFSVTLIASAAEWAPNVSYSVGTQVTYGGSTYQCLQAHTSLVGWEPPNVPALWQLITGGATPTATNTPTSATTPTATNTPSNPATPTATNTPSSGSGAIFYQNSNYSGTASQVIPPGNYTLSQLQAYGFVNDWASSCKTGGYTVIMYGDDNFTGTSWTLTSDNANFTTLSPSANDLVSSVKIQTGGVTPTATNTPTIINTPTSSSGGGWTGFVPPTVTFIDQATSLEGSTILHNAVPDIAQMMKDTCLVICQKIYTDNNDRRNNFTNLTLYLQDDPTGVAGKWGDPPSIYIGISAQYIANFYHNNGNSYAKVRSEVQGILAHEGTHGYQWGPKNCGTYDGSSEFYAFIEGLADYVRSVTFNWTPTRYPSKGGDWHNGYTTTGFFIKWICDNKKSTFAIDFNHAARDYSTFSWDTACRNITGIGVSQLWTEYQNSLP